MAWKWLGPLGAALAVAACSSESAPASGQGGGSSASSGTGGHAVNTTSTAIASSSSGPSPAHLVLPRVIDIPYVVAGTGGSSATIDVTNDGGLPLDGPSGGALKWSLAGDPALHLVSAPMTIASGGTAKVTLSYDGADAESIASAELTVQIESGTATAKVYGVSGDPGLGEGTWNDLTGPGGTHFGESITLSMPAAPFPHAGAQWNDASVNIFLPEGYRDRGAQDEILHFHGFQATVAETLTTHVYREHVYASGSNAVLVVPQGPIDADSGDFGKLQDPDGTARLLTEVLVALYREKRIEEPVLGQLVLTSHSGGYDALAYNLTSAAKAPAPSQVDLFDSLYGDIATYLAFAESSALYRSDYTLSAGTLANNEAFVTTVENDGHSVSTEQTQRNLAGSDPVIFYAPTAHDLSPRIDGAYGEQIRFALGHSRHGPRVELRSAVSSAGMATVKWLAPRDEDTTGFRVQTSADGATWATVATTTATEDHATFALVKGGARVRVLPAVTGIDDANVLASDVYRVDDGASVLVVDGFDRVIDGAFGGLAQDFSAIVGESYGVVASVSHRAIVEDAFDLSAYTTVIWLLGDESVDDHSLTADEQAAVTAFIEGGGSVVVSGTNVGYDLGGDAGGAAFLDATFGAAFAADNSMSYSATGQGTLAAVGAIAFSGPSSPYVAKDPDVFSIVGAGVEVVKYDTGKGAAVGVPGQAVLIGFPLELVDDATERAALVKALVGFAGG